MHRAFVFLLAAMLGLTSSACAKPSSPGSAASASHAQETPPMQDLYGKWFYAKDPKGEIAPNTFYEGGSITLTAEGGYKMEMKSGGYALEGTYTVRSASADEVVIETTYSGGRTNVLTFGLRRHGGEVMGMTLAETEDKVPTRYYQRDAP